MTGLEKFGLISGITGLVADGIALVTFFLGFWHPQLTINENILPPIAQWVIAITLVYGWFVISLVLALRTLKIKARMIEPKEVSNSVVSSIVSNSIISIGFLIVPIYLGLVFSLIDNANLRSYDNWYNLQVAKATRNAIEVLTPVPTVSNGRTGPYIPEEKSFEEFMAGAKVDRDLTYGTLVVFSLALYALIGLGIAGTINALLPLLYPDML